MSAARCDTIIALIDDCLATIDKPALRDRVQHASWQRTFAKVTAVAWDQTPILPVDFDIDFCEAGR